MGVYYPQGVMTLRVLLENKGDEATERLNKIYRFTVVCKNLSVNLNSYREADTFEATIDFKNFPFDPRTIRSAGVTINVEDRKKLFKTNNALNLLEPTPETTIFQGFVDEDSISLNEDARTVKLTGRDFTSLLIDREYIEKPIVLSKPLDQVFRDLLDQLPETRLEGNEGIRIVNQTGAPLPIIANFASDKEPSAGRKNPRKNRSYWDQIQEIVEQAGLIAYISLDELIITKPRTLYDRSRAKLFVFGKNLLNLDFKRKLGRQKGFNVRVVSLNIERKEVIDAKIPEQGTQEWAEDIGIIRKRIQIPTIKTNGEQGEPKDAPFITFRVRDVANFQQLVEIGQKIYEEMGRQQIEGSLTTKEMVVCDKQQNPFNATQFRIGTPIEVGIDQGDLKGLPQLVNGNPNVSKGAIKKFLIQRCYKPEVAAAFADSLLEFDTPFFTKEVEFTLDQENGWQMTINFINFIELPRSLVN